MTFYSNEYILWLLNVFVQSITNHYVFLYLLKFHSIQNNIMEQTLRNLVSQAKTEEAIKRLRQQTVADKDLHNRVIQISSRFQTYKRNLLGNLLVIQDF